MREFVDAGAMAVGKGTEEVWTKELGSPTARKGGVTGVAKGRRMLGLETNGSWHEGQVSGEQQVHGRCQ